MKKIKVTLVAELELPDDFKAQNDPLDGPILVRGEQCYMPILQWLEAPLSLRQDSSEREWDTASDDAAIELVDATQAEESKIKEVKD